MIDKSKEGWKSQIYLLGGVTGLLFGLVSSYLFARSAEENVRRNGEIRRVPTSQLLGLSLAALGIIRQITEMGKGGKD